MTKEELADQYRMLIEKGEMPQLLCKYRSIDQTLMFLENSQLWFAQLKSFNDPFESRYVIRSSKTLGKKIYDTLDAIYDSCGVLCLCVSWQNILMWTHYGHKHRGAALVFDVMEDVGVFTGLVPVTYTLDYPMVEPLNPKTYLRIMGDKFKGWQHEAEFRVLHPNSANRLKPVSPCALRHIVFGCRTSNEDIERVKALVARKGIFTNVTFLRCEMDDNEYKLTVRSI